jgi:predicted NUDIX family phosphoesterase
MSKNDELILCFEKSLLDSFSKENMTAYTLQEILRTPGVMQYKRRGDVETDTSILQPIPYCIVFCRATKRILSYKRSKKGGETRLHDMYSIGFGGHININDMKNCLKELDEKDPHVFGYRCPIRLGAYRELEEELSLTRDDVRALQLFKWYIYDDTSEVSSVHIGLPYLCLVNEEADIKLAEDTAIELRWLDFDALNDADLNFESWSSIAIAELNTSKLGRETKARSILVHNYGMDEEAAMHCVQDMVTILEPGVKI